MPSVEEAHPVESDGVAERFSRLRRRIEDAAGRSSRSPGEIVLVGASKRQPIELLRAAYDAGLRDFGENHVQEAERKAPQLPSDVRWHLLGPLQSNKIRRATQLFVELHAVDRIETAIKIERQLEAAKRPLAAYVEVNVGGESSKHGFAPKVCSRPPASSRVWCTCASPV